MMPFQTFARPIRVFRLGDESRKYHMERMACTK